MIQKLYFTFCVILLLVPATSLAQVTIGSGLIPEEGALLDMKQNVSAGDNTTATKGFLLPRVKLEGNTSLAPMLTTEGTSAEKTSHTGLLVFHVGGNGIDAGLKIWNGTVWSDLAGFDGAVQNGLNYVNSTLKLGGALTGSTVITANVSGANLEYKSTQSDANFLITGDAKLGVNTQTPLGSVHVDPIGDTSESGANSGDDFVILADGKVGIGTATPTTNLDVNGDLRLRTLTELADPTGLVPLYANGNGNVGFKPETATASPIFLGKSAIETIYSVASFNNGVTLAFPFALADIKINNLGVTVQNGFFKIKDSGTYQITASTNFVLDVETIPSKVFINVNIQKSSNNGNSWQTIVGIRPVFNIDWSQDSSPILLPTTIADLGADDLIRISFKRTYDVATPQGDDVTYVRTNQKYDTPSFSLILLKL